MNPRKAEGIGIPKEPFTTPGGIPGLAMEGWGGDCSLLADVTKTRESGVLRREMAKWEQKCSGRVEMYRAARWQGAD